MTRTTRWSVTGLLALAICIVPSNPAAGDDEDDSPSDTGRQQVVMKLSAATGCDLDTVLASYALVLDDSVLASRRIYRVHSARSGGDDDHKLADQLGSDRCVAYAEPDTEITLRDDQFHSWTPGSPHESSQDQWQSQSARSVLQLDAAHQTALGSGVVVAVLDTGVDEQQPALTGTLLPGHDYVADDGIPEDAPAGVDSDADGDPDSAVGHGTFVAGMVTMVAPDARILPLKVLDSDGSGSIFLVAEAMYDAIASGVQVINMSFGTTGEIRSKMLDQAFKAAERSGVAIVAAAGNEENKRPTYPAAVDDVWAVAATNPAESTLASYSNQGKWVDVAAVGTDLVGPLPQGRYGTWSGTSLSAPLFAGQLALLWSTDPGRDERKVHKAITKTCRKLQRSEMKNGVIDLVSSLRYLHDH